MQAEASRSDVSSEVGWQWNRHQTLEICIVMAVTPGTDLIVAASFVTGNRLSLSFVLYSLFALLVGRWCGVSIFACFYVVMFD